MTASSEETGPSDLWDGALRGTAALCRWVEQELGALLPETSPGGSAFRHLVLEEWLWELVADRGRLTEDAFLIWLKGKGEDRVREDGEVASLRGEARRKALEWLVRDPGSDSGGTHRFGSLPFLELAVATAGWPVERTYSVFSSFSRLDRGVGQATAGLLAVFLAQAVGETPYRAGFAAWFFNTAGRSLGTLRLRGAADPGLRRHLPWLEQIEETVIEGYEAGKALSAGGGISPSRPGLERGGAHGELRVEEGDPLGLWRRIAFALAAGGKSLERVFASFGATDPADWRGARVVASLSGAWYGEEGLRRQGGALGAVTGEGLWRELGLDPELRIGMPHELALLLSAPFTPP